MQVIDCWVNASSSEFVPPFNERVLQRMMERAPQVAENAMQAPDLSSLLALMDACGVTKAVLTDPYGSEILQREVDAGLAFAPERFAGCAAIHPTTAANDRRRIRDLKSRGYRSIKVLGVFSDLPYDDPKYFPIYAACEEEDLVLTCTVGLPHVPLSNQRQDPLTLDPVLAHFPDLTVVMCHGGLPWAESCVALMRKWTNLYWMTSALDQKLMPPAIVDYARKDGGDRLMFATDFPAHHFNKTIAESELINTGSTRIAENFAWRVADKLFFN